MQLFPFLVHTVYILHLQQDMYSEADNFIFNFCCLPPPPHTHIKRCWEFGLMTFIATVGILPCISAFLKVFVMKTHRHESVLEQRRY